MKKILSITFSILFITSCGGGGGGGNISGPSPNTNNGNVDGGAAASVYLVKQHINGGTASG